MAMDGTGAVEVTQAQIRGDAESMVLVPRLPTEEMRAAGFSALFEAGVDSVEDGDAEAVWSAMLKAAALSKEDEPAPDLTGMTQAEAEARGYV